MTQPPGGSPQNPGADDPTRRLRLIRNIIIGVIVLVAGVAVIGSCTTSAFGTSSARKYAESHYQRAANLDESGVAAYVADGDPTAVEKQLADTERPNDKRSGDTRGVGNVAGTRFLQYPDYLIALFPYAAGKTRVMISRDYRSGYNHYHSYVGGFWVPTPSFGGSGSSNRGGGSGGGGK